MQASPLQQLLLQQLQLLLLHALVEANLLELLRGHANVAVGLGPLTMLLLLWHIIVLLGGAVAVAAAAGAAAVAGGTGNMLPAGRIAVGIVVVVAVGVAVAIAVVRAIDSGPGAGGTAFGNVYESHDER